MGYTVSGTVTVNGLPPTRSTSYCAASGNLNDQLGVITFTDPLRNYVSNYQLTCANTAGGFTWSVLLAPGNYTVRVRPGTYAAAAQVNLLGVDYVAIPGLNVMGNLSNQVLPEVGYTVSGSVTVNGAPPTRNGTYCSASGNLNDQLGVISFTDAQQNYLANYQLTCANTAGGFTWSVLLAPGNYTVRVRPGTYAAAAQVNLLGVDYVAIPGLNVMGNLSDVVLPEVGYTVSGSVTVNGAPPTRSGTYCSASGNLNDQLGVISFTDAQQNYLANYQLTCATTASGFTWSVLLAPGNYTVRVRPGTYAAAAQVNLLGVDYVAIPGLNVMGNLSDVVLPEVGYTVSGSVTVNGAPPTRSGTYCSASGNLNDQLGVISFTDAQQNYLANYQLTCANTAGGFTWSVLLAPGNYTVRVRPGTYAAAAQVNLLGVDYVAIPALNVMGNLSNQVLPEVGYTVSGSVTVNGAPPTRSGTYCSASGNLNDQLGVISFTDAQQNYLANYQLTCATTASGFTWSVLLAPGTYTVRVRPGTYAAAAQVNLLGVDYLALPSLRIP